MRIAEATVQLPDVSAVQPFERTFWARLDTGLDHIQVVGTSAS